MSDDGAAGRGGTGPPTGRIIEVCGRFEEAWSRGLRPRIEDHLGDPPDAVVAQALIELEILLREEAGERPAEREYRARFPGLGHAVSAAFANRGDRPPPTPPTPPRPGAPRRWPARLLGTIRALFSRRPPDVPGDAERAESTVGDDPETTIQSTATFADDRAPEDDEGDEPGDRHEGDRFALHEEIGRGNMGVVHRGYDRELRRAVALKRICDGESSSEAFRRQFRLEALVTGYLDHPGIVPVYALGTREVGELFYAMRLFRDSTLKAAARRLHAGKAGSDPDPDPDPDDDAPTLPRLLRHFVSACYAVDYAHAKGLLHRDIKPEHIWIGRHGETLLVDWGLACTFRRKDPEDRLDGDAFRPPRGTGGPGPDGARMGSPAFMSPEQARGLNSTLDDRSDVYGLGATLAYILTGRTRFRRNASIPEVLEKTIHGDFPSPRQQDPRVPVALERICLKAMALSPADRYQSARELARDVERWLDDEPVTAYPEPLPHRAWRWLRRHRTLAVSGLTLLLAVTAASGALSIVLRKWYSDQRHANGVIRAQASQVRAAYGQARLDQQAAEAARDRAEASLDLSRGLVHDLLIQVADAKVPRIPASDELRLYVAGYASRALKDLLEQAPDDDATRFELGQAYRTLGKVLQIIGRPEARSIYVQAHNLVNALVKKHPDEAGYLDYLAEICFDAGECCRMAGDMTRAAPFYERALRHSEALVQRFGDRPDYRRTRARALYNHASYRADLGDYEAASEGYEAALAILRPEADAPDPPPTVPLEVALVCEELGAKRRLAGEPEAARAALEEAARRAEAILADDADQPDARFVLACVRCEQGRFDDAFPLLEGLVEESPRIAEYRRQLARAHLARADARPEGADDDLEAARRHLTTLLEQSKDNPVDSGLLGRVLGRLARRALANGERDDARALAERATALQDVALKANKTSPPDLDAMESHRRLLAEIDGGGPPR